MNAMGAMRMEMLLRDEIPAIVQAARRFAKMPCSPLLRAIVMKSRL